MTNHQLKYFMAIVEFLMKSYRGIYCQMQTYFLRARSFTAQQGVLLVHKQANSDGLSDLLSFLCLRSINNPLATAIRLCDFYQIHYIDWSLALSARTVAQSHRVGTRRMSQRTRMYNIPIYNIPIYNIR